MVDAFPSISDCLDFYGLKISASTFKSIMKNVRVCLILLLVATYLLVDISALGFVTEIFIDEQLSEIFAHSETRAYLTSRCYGFLYATSFFD